jgi:uncharacterized lipoprotein YddW (UPF0748 family)
LRRSLDRLLPWLFLVSFATVLLTGSLTSAIAQLPPPTIRQIPSAEPIIIPVQPAPGVNPPQIVPVKPASQPLPQSITPIPPLLPEIPPLQPQQPLAEIRGVWLTTNDTQILSDRPKLQAALQKLRQLNFNTIYPVVWNSGYVMYPSAVARQAGIPPFLHKGTQGHDPLADLIAQAHRQGLLVVPWFEFGFMVPPLSELTIEHPNWLTQRQDGSQESLSAAGQVAWLNPFHPEVQQFITSLVVELVARYDVDGIQFDDHTSLPNDFGYDPYTVALYRQETNRDPHPDPQNPDWVRWRADKLTEFMARLNQAVKTQKPRAIFSVSPASYDYAYKAQLQDWLTWVRLNIVDELIVQVYQLDLRTFAEKIGRPEMQEAQQKIPTGVGVLTGLRNRPVPIQLIQSKVKAARDRGLGVAFFYYESLWDLAPEPTAKRQAAFQAFFSSPASRRSSMVSSGN